MGFIQYVTPSARIGIMKRKFGTIAAGLIALLLVGGFIALAFTSVPVTQSEIRKTIPNEQFFQKKN